MYNFFTLCLKPNIFSSVLVHEAYFLAVSGNITVLIMSNMLRDFVVMVQIGVSQIVFACRFICTLCLIIRERTIIGSVSYQNRYWVYRIESYPLLLYRPILRASLQVQHELLTGRIKQQIKGHSRRSPDPPRGSPAREARSPAVRVSAI